MSRPIVKVEAVISPEWGPLIIKRVKMKGYKTTAEYLRDLIRRDLEKAGLLAEEAEEVITA